MPSQVPPGYTRGSIMFIAAESGSPYQEALLQRFWNEAGAYGARIVIIALADANENQVDEIHNSFVEWESDTVALIRLINRMDALEPTSATQIDGATGILLIGRSPLEAATTLGGTPMAQAIRKANARNKVVGAIGGCASILCQHMITFLSNKSGRSESMVQFVPGLGLLNRLALDASTVSDQQQAQGVPNLTLAVAYNPFLTAVQLNPNSGVAVYADSTLELFGSGSAKLVDGSRITSINLHNLHHAEDGPCVMGAIVHTLWPGYTFNFDTRGVARPETDDIPSATDSATSAF